ncbi:hypothetical protein Ga0123462_0285 [Mariprofundus ferrinatatus]|uniref:Uncharacterized protein n=2 Tax=Mariprofundus ferrinatatus TaxID=1921087 RepID=A0A2K8L1G2_9PROT|nr:hypothetical protein Ga0123462_0285 [Mariprofundus ferrinatatus]
MPSAPQFVQLSFGFAYRYKDKDIYQAIIQKLARVQSLVRAALLLLNHGFVQEQAALQRAIDETNEDIDFLVYAVTNDSITELHERFLDAFWEEEIDESGTMMGSRQKRPMIPRKKIQAYLARIDGDTTHQEAVRTLSKAYSGYVHGASPHIMDMYGGNPPHFHTSGMLGTPMMEAHADDLWNYVYRGFISHIIVCKAFGKKAHVDILNEHLYRFEQNAGMRD